MNGIDIFTLLILITGIIAILFNITSVLINRKILIIFTAISNFFRYPFFTIKQSYFGIFMHCYFFISFNNLYIL
jgi:hypothetical protein